MKLIEQIQSYLNWIDERDEMPEWMDGSEWCEILDVSETWEFVLLRMAKEKIIQLEAELDRLRNKYTGDGQAYQGPEYWQDRLDCMERKLQQAKHDAYREFYEARIG